MHDSNTWSRTHIRHLYSSPCNRGGKRPLCVTETTRNDKSHNVLVVRVQEFLFRQFPNSNETRWALLIDRGIETKDLGSVSC